MSAEETRVLRFLERNLESILSLVYSVHCVASVGVAAVFFFPSVYLSRVGKRVTFTLFSGHLFLTPAVLPYT